MQWGFSSGNGAADITFPITFGTLYSITQGFCNSGSVNNWNWAISSYSVSKFHVIGKGGIGLFWIAVGKAQQWGTYEIAKLSTELITITFPVSFAATAYSVTLGHKGPSNWTNGANVNYVNKTVSDMTVYYCDGYGFSWLAIGMQQWGVINAPAFPDNGQPVTFPIKFSKIPSVITAINQAKNSASSTQLFTASINAYTTTSNMILHRYGGLTSSDARVDWFAWSV